MKLKFETNIAYNQFAVCQSGIEQPFNDWQEKEINQGFSWRAESVCFSTLENGRADFEVHVFESLQLSTFSDDALRIIQVPFSVLTNTGIEVAGILDQPGDHLFAIQPGAYTLMLEHGVGKVRKKRTFKSHVV
jgi:hypothetical protein